MWSWVSASNNLRKSVSRYTLILMSRLVHDCAKVSMLSNQRKKIAGNHVCGFRICRFSVMQGILHACEPYPLLAIGSASGCALMEWWWHVCACDQTTYKLMSYTYLHLRCRRVWWPVFRIARCRHHLSRGPRWCCVGRNEDLKKGLATKRIVLSTMINSIQFKLHWIILT
jgi:hypothetical protein